SAFKAEKILFNIAGSENLSMFEVEKISSHISNSNPEAKIIFGISKNPKLKNKIKTTILMTGGQAVEEVVVKKPELIEEIVQIEIPVKKEVVVEESKIELKQEKKSVEKKKIKKAKKKIVKPKKPVNKVKDNSDRKNRPVIRPDAPSDDSAVSFIPVFQAPLQTKATIRRSGLEIKEAEELQEKKRIEQEKEWEIPAFLRKVKYKN
ncbi:MAG: hypothetical protein NTV36_02865, partial [Candidatus Staskawiczbacteria bacterium]|nr:hypothetical protein [Candidatus Staskawiczbacteria bacterium]